MTVPPRIRRSLTAAVLAAAALAAAAAATAAPPTATQRSYVPAAALCYGSSCSPTTAPRPPRPRANPDPEPDISNGIDGGVVGGDGATIPDWPDLLVDTPGDRVVPNPCAWKFCLGDEGDTHPGTGLQPGTGDTGVCSPWCIIIVPTLKRVKLRDQLNPPPPAPLPSNDPGPTVPYDPGAEPPGSSGYCSEYGYLPPDFTVEGCTYWQTVG